MATLTVTARGQVTFRKEVLYHLGIGSGGKIELDLLPDGRAALKAARPSGTMDGFLGLLAVKTSRVATLEEIGESAAWDGRRDGTPPHQEKNGSSQAAAITSTEKALNLKCT